MELPGLIAELDQEFKQRLEHFEAYTAEGVQVEGWFKGEILVILRRLTDRGVITGFAREHPATTGGRKKIDFIVDAGGQEVAIELKAWLDGFQKGARWRTHHYCTADPVIGIGPDLEKLQTCACDQKIVVAFCHANPGRDGWMTALQALAKNLSQFSLRSLTKPEDYPSQYFMAVLELISSGPPARRGGSPTRP
jgi:hypothetical protein